MGVWGAGLYSGDIAVTFRATIGAVSRLPFEVDKLVEIVRSTDSKAADDRSNEDHTIFWLVLADQFWKKGVQADATFARALEIIDSNRDIDVMRSLGMGEGDLKKRGAQLQSLRTQLLSPPPQKKRTVLKSPEPYVMDVGDVFVYPTCEGTPHQRRSLREPGTLYVHQYGRSFGQPVPAWSSRIGMRSRRTSKSSRNR